MFVRRFTPNQYRFSPFPLAQTNITKKFYYRLLKSLFMIHWDTNASKVSTFTHFRVCFHSTLVLHYIYN